MKAGSSWGKVLISGIACSIAASVLFGAIYFYSSLLSPLTGSELFGWRMLLTAPSITAFMLLRGEWSLVVNVFQRIREKPSLVLTLLISSALISLQMWVFMWAPLNGYGLDVSLGYFLLPLSMVVAGRLLYRERLSALRKVATLLAAIGVANEIYQVGSFSWVTMLVALGYPAYFVIRRQWKFDHLGGLWWDMALILPVALWFAIGADVSLVAFAERPALYWMIPFLGLMSGMASICFILASRLLTFSLFGLLNYLEPVLMICVALALGESIAQTQWLTYAAIWMSVIVLLLEGIQQVRLSRALQSVPS